MVQRTRTCSSCGEPRSKCAHWEHGTLYGYRRRKCRCVPCRLAWSEDCRRYQAKSIVCLWCNQQATVIGHRGPARFCSISCSRFYTDGRCQANANGTGRSAFSIPRKRRQAIYERDGWICQLCHDPVDSEAKDEWRASLDHIVPQSHQLFPDHSDGNLRLTHLWCNIVRGDARRPDDWFAA